MNFKDSWNTSNHNFNCLPHVITLNVTFSALESQSTISQPSLSIRKTALLPAKSSLQVLIWLPHRAPSHMQIQNSWDPTTAVMDRILMRPLNMLEHYLTIGKKRHTMWLYTAAHWSLSSIRVIPRLIYQVNNCTQWRSVFNIVLRFKLSVYKPNAYLRCVNEQAARDGPDGIDWTTRCDEFNLWRGVMAHQTGFSRGNSKDCSESNS